MIDAQQKFLQLALEKLREVPGIRQVRAPAVEMSFSPVGLRAELEVQVASNPKPYVLTAIFKGSFDRSVIDRILLELTDKRRLEKAVIVAPYVNPNLAEYMNNQGLNFIDLAGNYRLALGSGFFVFTKGKRPPEGSPYVPKARIAGFQIIFAILADPLLLNEPVRHIAEKAGVGKSAVASRLARLDRDGFIGKTSKGWKIVRHEDLMDRWLVGYSEVIAPRLFTGSYRTRITDNPDELESLIEKRLEGNQDNWAWGALSAAWRMAPYYRGDTTVLHVAQVSVDIIMATQALPSREGNLIFMRPFGPLSFEGTMEHLVHPLLVYTQLITSADPRARETAAEISKYLPRRE